MREFLSVLVFLFVLFDVLFGADARINGPDETPTGAMFVLDSTESVGDVNLWIAPAIVGENNIQCGGKFATAISMPGTYEFILVVSDKEPSISYARHTVVVTSANVPGVPTPPDPRPDPNPDQPSFEAVRKASRDAATSTRDGPTISHMITSLELAVPKLTAKSLIDAQKSVSYVVEGVLLQRTGESRDSDWLSWRKQVNAAIEASGCRNSSQYAKAISAAIDGLKGASDAMRTNSPTLYFYSSPGCTVCAKWEQLVMPTLISKGVRVEKVTSGHSEPLVPTFVGGGKRFVGFMSIQSYEHTFGHGA